MSDVETIFETPIIRTTFTQENGIVSQFNFAPTVINEAPGSGSDAHYEHTQSVASATWTVNHGLGKKPAITIFDSSGDECEGAITHVSNNQATITFSAAFSGVAICN